jgi:NTE family protein
LVLGAGGVLGGAWLVGALQALASETGWDPGSADYIVGTSAGAMIGALSASGVPPWFMVAHSAGEDVNLVGADGRPVSEADRSAGGSYRLHRGVPVLGPGSWRLALASLARPYRYAPAAVLAGWLPEGIISSDPLRDTVRRAAGHGWAPHPNLWIMASDYEDGQPVAFGRQGAPAASLADAVAASCAVPGFYRPARIGGRRYIDGGVHSLSNLDVLADLGLDLVICLNPMSSLHAPPRQSMAERAAGLLRQASGRAVGREAKRVRASGTEVVLIQPTVHDLDAMGSNLMNSRRRHQVIETAVRTVTEHLREPAIRDALTDLPAGIPALVTRPPGAPSTWPDFRELARLRRTPALAARRRTKSAGAEPTRIRATAGAAGARAKSGGSAPKSMRPPGAPRTPRAA